MGDAWWDGGEAVHRIVPKVDGCSLFIARFAKTIIVDKLSVFKRRSRRRSQTRAQHVAVVFGNKLCLRFVKLNLTNFWVARCVYNRLTHLHLY